MKFPVADHLLMEAGWRLIRKSPCRGNICGAQIHWWKTPKAKLMPMSFAAGTMLLEPHWITCPNGAEFRKAKVG